MEATVDILTRAERFVFDYFQKKFSGIYVYHNFNHVVDMMTYVKKIAVGEGLNESEIEMVKLAVWFHDTGYEKDGTGHEEKSVEIAGKWLKEQGYPEEKIEKISGCIRATGFPQHPNTLMQKVICDTDLAYLGTKSFFDRSALLRAEWEFTRSQVYTEAEWLKIQTDFLASHKYFTPTAQLEYNSRKAKNLAKHYKELNAINRKEKDTEKKEALETKKADEKSTKAKRPDRGVETMFRVTSRNHMELSAMADNKANIMISINAIIVSITVSVMVSKFDSNPHLIIPTVFLLAVCLGTIIFATLSTRPKITEGKFSDEDIKNRKVNLLFFGNFYRMSFEKFKMGMEEMMVDKDFLYGTMVMDIFAQGKVLSKKYKLIRISYNIFMYGLIAAVISFGISMIIWGQAS